MLLLRCSTGAGLASGPAALAASAPGASGAYRVEFQAVWRAVRDQFYDEICADLDWSAVGAQYRARLETVQSDPAFAALVNQMEVLRHSGKRQPELAMSGEASR